MLRNQTSTKHKSKKIHGLFEDSNRWVRCWNCDAPLDTHNSSLVGGTGNHFADIPIASEISDNDPRNRLATMDVVSLLGVAMKEGADGNPLPIYSPRGSNASGGCWRCGTNNLP
jgi:hypothetical protein